MNIVAFSIQTIPDTDIGRSLYGNAADMALLNEKDVARVMWLKQDQDAGGKAKYMGLHLQKILHISMIVRSSEGCKLELFSSLERPEADVLNAFYQTLHFNPMLVTWDGLTHEIPLLQYRSLYHRVASETYWKHYHPSQHQNQMLGERHTVLKPVLSAYQPQATALREELAAILGIPLHPPLSAEQIWTFYLQQDYTALQQDCMLQTLQTYLIYLMFQQVRNELNKDELHTECDLLKNLLHQRKHEGIYQLLEHWQDGRFCQKLDLA
ncbi:3'-5' exonuclease family protein [Candidatus Venteria ishoeyi]|uniref:Putative 3'-5' exonuclease related to the exonuclease domain of PolB n=1 Tax=Candidatus Venteria ishoeyi TaxID=1899563 RepID=A0A1H6F876_9GAMM|nr:hypothetical protein [Candidatus Venteria ishoeyi]MDM8546504.1 hypothetical protein [Candidatus Venteria ishoeyi]SEH06328.1 putative 3'-5' exonuclease related to the exonuclease domain of PolB [Candidatus Venteria ishoeyi]